MGAIAFYAIYSENKRADTQLSVARESNKFRLYAEAMRGRQSTDAALKADLVEPLIDLKVCVTERGCSAYGASTQTSAKTQ